MRILYKLLMMTIALISLSIVVISYVSVNYGYGDIFYLVSVALLIVCGGISFFVAGTITKPAQYLIKESTDIANFYSRHTISRYCY